MKRIILFFFLFTICSCTKTFESEIPYARVWMELNLTFADKDLVPLLSSKEFMSPRLAGESVGYAGLLVVHGYDNQYLAYDRCCPNEARREVVIVPGNNDGTATCPTCKTVYDIANGGFPLSGPSKYALKRYNLTVTNEKIRILN